MILRYFVMCSGLFLLVALLNPAEQKIIEYKSAVYVSKPFPEGEFACLPLPADGEECYAKRRDSAIEKKLP